ncbi:MAG TPA: hypothetical protein VG148_16435 [Pyrinomonadaceae bacterium]|nr:hypothetical protein [Pyrinomonadaceae bacterium]
MSPRLMLACAPLLLLLAHVAHARQARGAAARDREIAAQFAPAVHQALGEPGRADFITRFDFDGDWRGDNNWANAEDRRHALRAYVYFAVSETATHFFVHYAFFHPRDYKGGGRAGPLLSEAIREGARRGGRFDPTGLSAEAVLAHENDMEGCLVVAAKDGDDPALARVVFVETLAHDRFLKYAAAAEVGQAAVRLDGARALLYVEPKGHGVAAYDGGPKQTPTRGAVVYRFKGRAEDPEARTGEEVGYDLLPISETLWARARGGPNLTYGQAYDYGTRSLTVAARGRAATRRVRIGRRGAAFRGRVGAPDAARPPWAWFDREERDAPPGSWFFDPAATVKRHFRLGADFSTAYLHAPLLGVTRR